jgi:hypothetical protein
MAQGYISAIKEKDTKAGKMYDFVIDGRNIGAGKFPPKGFAAGDYVNYEMKENGNFLNLVSGSMSKAPVPAGVEAPKAAPAVSSGGGGSGGWDERQAVISRQAALNSALTFVNLLASQDALPMPAKVTKDKKSDLLQSILYEYAAQFHKLSTGVDMEFPEASAKDLSPSEEDENWQE